MDEKYITEYSARGALLDLSKYDIDTAKLRRGRPERWKGREGPDGHRGRHQRRHHPGQPGGVQGRRGGDAGRHHLDLGRLRADLPPR